MLGENRMQEQVRYDIQRENVSTAYEFPAYDARVQTYDRRRIISIVQKRRRRAMLRAVAKNLLLCCFCITLLGGILVSTSQLNELTTKAAAVQSRNEMLVSEQKRLTALCDMQINLAEIETIATEKLYMQKLEQDQIVYIRLTGSDYGTVVQGEDHPFARFQDSLRLLAQNMSKLMG